MPPSSRGYPARPHPVGPTCLPQDLTPASGRQDHTILPSAATSLVSGLFDRSRIQRTRPAIPSPARRCRVHRIPSRVRDDRDTPLCVGRDGQSSRGDLGGTETEIFFKRGLDTPFNKPPDGQITGLRREQIPLVSRTRRSVLPATPTGRECAPDDRLRVVRLRCTAEPGPTADRAARWTPDQQRTTPQVIARRRRA